MHLYLYILLYCFLLPKTSPKQIEIKCPAHCKCDIFEKLKRATCTHRNLANLESNLPQQTQLLDLSYNQIIHLNDHVFMDEKLTSLKLLNISHNKVSQIHMNAFQGLTHLKTLDLSYNGVQYTLNNWFLDLESLEELYLRGNSFSRLENGALISSKTLKRLDLSDCRMSFISATTLTELPNLEILDLSDNYLIHLSVATIEPLTNLNVLNVNNTMLSCDGVTQNLSDFCVQKGIKYQDPCKKIIVSESEKFQRMTNMEDGDEKNSWIFDDEEEIKNDNKTKIIETCNNTRVDKSLLQEIVDLSPLLSILIPFIYGIGVGVLIAYILHVCTEKKKNLNGSTYLSFEDSNTHLQRRRSGRFDRMSGRFTRAFSTEEQQTLPLREWNISESTPVLYRKNQAQL